MASQKMRVLAFTFAAFACTAYADDAEESAETTTEATTTTTTTIGDCVCESSWIHDEFKCNSSTAGSIGTVTFQGCPALSALAACEDMPQQSWCKTTHETCTQQQGEAIGDGWAFCNSGAQKAEVPKCTCAAVWLNGHGAACQGINQQKRSRGCPTMDELLACDPDYSKDQSWCLTNEDECSDQVDCPDCAAPDYSVGKQWSYCDEDTQLTELPDCECEDNWIPDDWQAECPDWTGANPPTFDSCPTPEQLSKCNKANLGDQAWCKTKQARCKQQSDSDVHESMINDQWSYCNPTDNKPVFPTCECKASWADDDSKCDDEPITFEGCPTLGSLKICDTDTDQPWCETTYKRCSEQNYEAINDHWVYCDSETEEPDLPLCECQEIWTHTEPNTECEGHGTKFRGCPTEEELSVCEPDAASWCMTKDELCKEQSHETGSYNDGWAYCDANTQMATEHAARRGSAIGLTFIFTVIMCGGLFIAMMFAYRKHLKEKQVGYSRALGGYENNDKFAPNDNM